MKDTNHSFVINALSILHTEEIYLNIKIAVYDKLTTVIMANDKILPTFPLRLETHHQSSQMYSA